MATNIGPKIGIDGEAEYRKQIQQIIQETRTLKAEYEKLSTSTDNNSTSLKRNKELHRNLKEQIEAQTKKIEEMRNMTAQAADKFDETDPKLLKWKENLYKAETELNNMQSTLRNLPSQLDLIGQKFTNVGDKIKSAGDKMQNWGQKLAPISAAASGALVGSAKAAIDFESAMTGVMKTNDELVDSNGNVIISYDDLAESVKKMSTETASTKSEIAGVMEAAGQLGVGTEYLADFTKDMIMLGDSTTLSSEEAASAIAKFANITGMSLNDTNKLGSSITYLGNNFATTETDIVNMATRLAGAGSQIGLSQAEIMGFATALSSVGIEAEMGGSAFSKAMVKMQVAAETGYEPVIDLQNKVGMSLRDIELMSTNDTKTFKELAQSLGMTTTELKATITAGNNLNDFAAVAQMSTEDFVELYRNDTPAALQAFIKGLGDTDGAGASTIAMLQEMGFTETRLRDTLTRLANANGLVTTAVNDSRQAWQEETALIDEASQKYDDHAVQIHQTKENVSNLAIDVGEKLLPIVEKGLIFVNDLISAWDKLDPDTQDMIVKAVALTAALAPVISIGGKLVSGIGGLVSGIGMLASPVGLFIAGAAAVVAAGVLIYKNWDEICAWADNLKERIGKAWDGIKQATSDLKDSVSEKWNDLKEKVSDSKIGQIISDNWNAAKETAKEAMTDIKAAYDEHGGGLEGAVYAGMEAVKQYHEFGWNYVDNLTGGKLTKIKDTVSEKWNQVKDKTSEVWDNMKSNAAQKWENIKTTVTTRAEAIKKDAGIAWDNLVTNTKNKFEEVKKNISQPFKDAWDTVKSKGDDIWDKLKSLGDKISGFQIKFPDIKMPHFNVSWVDYGKFSLPSVSVDWYAKAMDKGIRLTSPTIFGAAGGKLLGGGEVGNEWVIGENSLMQMIRSAVGNNGGSSVNIGDTTIVINASDSDTAEEIAERVDEIITSRLEALEAAWA